MLFCTLLLFYLYFIEKSHCSNLINRALSIFFILFFYPSFILCFSLYFLLSFTYSYFIYLFIYLFLSSFIYLFISYFHTSFISSFLPLLSFPQTMGGLETLTSLQSLWMGKNKIEELGGGKCRFSCIFTSLLPCI